MCRPSTLKSLRFLEIASFSVIIAASDLLNQYDPKKEITLNMLWHCQWYQVWHFSLTQVLSVSKWRMWLCTWLTLRRIFCEFRLQKPQCSWWNLYGSQKFGLLYFIKKISLGSCFLTIWATGHMLCTKKKKRKIFKFHVNKTRSSDSTNKISKEAFCFHCDT